VDVGYQSNLLTLVKNCGFADANLASLILRKKMADTKYCGPPSI